MPVATDTSGPGTETGAEAKFVQERREAAAAAIELGIHGGMFRLATRVYEELDVDSRAALELAPPTWTQLAKIFAVRGDAQRASDCRARSVE